MDRKEDLEKGLQLLQGVVNPNVDESDKLSIYRAGVGSGFISALSIIKGIGLVEPANMFIVDKLCEFVGTEEYLDSSRVSLEDVKEAYKEMQKELDELNA